MSSIRVFVSTLAACGVAAVASADVSISQGDSAASYSVGLNFDQAGQATGPIAANYWQPSYGIVIDAGDGGPIVGDWGAAYGPWLGSGNSFFGNFGVFITFDTAVTGFSAQVWDPSGDPTPFGGGLFALAYSNGVEVASVLVTPAWSTSSGSWFDISAAGGSSFDEVRFVGLGFTPETFIDNLSWSPVPAPGAIALLGLCGLAGRRRRD